MAEHAGGHGGHGQAFPHSTHQPSWWPLVVGLAVAILGLSLFWARGEDSEDATVPVVAAAAAFVVISAFGWAVEEGALARRMRGQRTADHLAVRNTQVVTFTIPEGQIGTARADGGVLHALQQSEGGLRAYPGFEDLRVTVSPAETGPSQALVETTWASSEALAGYDSAKNTILDLLSSAGDQVVPGSVQAFDMEVVRDTKESPVRFTFLNAVVALGALVIGGAAVGIVAGAVQEDGAVVADGGATTPPAGDGGAVASGPVTLLATDNKFDKKTITVAVGSEVEITLKNNGKVPHNLAVLTKQDGDPVAATSKTTILTAGKSETIKFAAPPAGTYYFVCELHPAEMNGQFIVK